MNGSIKIGSVLGITIRIHVLLLLFAGLVVLQASRTPGGAGTAGIWIATLFAIVLLHELAHSVVAKHYGLRVVDITLWPLGGMARMSEIPESSRIEGWIAIAGPLLNFVLAALAFPVLLWTLLSDVDVPVFQAWTFSFLLANLGLGLFNLLPAFPMDGGRILRAFLGRGGDWVGATERAVNVGRAVALCLAVFGCLSFSLLGTQSLLFVLVAGFVWWTGTQELLAVRARHGLDPLAAFKAFTARATGWSQTQPASEFARATSPRPAPAAPPPVSPDARGFSESDIDRMERFRGPLRALPPEEP